MPDVRDRIVAARTGGGPVAPSPVQQPAARGDVRDTIIGSRGGAGSSPTSVYARKPPSVGGASGSGFLGFIGDVASDLYDAAVNSPRGLYEAGRIVVNDVRKNPLSYMNPYTFAVHQANDPSSPIRQIGGTMIDTTIEDLRHPLRHPGNTLLDLVGIASLGAGTASRVAAVGKALKVGDGARALDVLVSGVKPGVMTMRASASPGMFARAGETMATATRPYSRSTLARFTQRHLNDLRNAFPNLRIGVRTQNARVGAAVQREWNIELRKATAGADTLALKGRKVGPFSERGMALRSVAEETPLGLMQDRWRKVVADPETPDWARKLLAKRIATAERAKRYVTDAGVPEIRPEFESLRDLSDLSREVSLWNDQTLVDAGLAEAGVLSEAISKAGRVWRGAEYVNPTASRLGLDTPRLVGLRDRVARLEKLAEKQALRDSRLPEHLGGREISPRVRRLNSALSVARDELQRAETAAAARVRPTGLVGAEGFVASDRGYHVGQQLIANKAPSDSPQFVRNTVAATGTKARSALRKPLTGAASKSPLMRQDVPTIVANTVKGDQHTIIRIEQGRELFDAGQDTAAGMRNPYPVRSPDSYGKPADPNLRSIVQHPNETMVQRAIEKLSGKQELDAETRGVFRAAQDSIREWIYPVENERQALLRAWGNEPHPDIRWVERDMISPGLRQPPILAAFKSTPTGRTVLGFFDLVNNATKVGILYLKPAYAVPNLVGNTFLVLTQQGAMAPVNIARASRLARRLGANDTVLLDSLMGEGLTASLAGGGGIGQLAATAGANFYGKFVDVPFRRASFIHEANKAGFKGAPRLKQLLHDPANKDALSEVVQRANRAVISYNELTPLEQSIIRRVLFFYPWLKGSTRYAGEYLRDHPVQAALLGIQGELGTELTQQELGDLPSWAQGLMRVGGSDRMPLVVNPTAAGILSQPVQLGAVVSNLLTGGPKGTGYQLRGLLTPAISAMITAATGQDEFGRPQSAPFPATFVSDLKDSFALELLRKRLMEDQSNKTYPYSSSEALLKFLLGLNPVRVDRARLNDNAARENGG